ncbi:hypothetical protein HUF15_05230 [Streptomyces samsunensis]|uniref:Uncharacterized protein n=3 Tax=Streptomyces malaysiensis TaxID=92644 RepID=A0A2J7Z3S0_STRMQ|nr:MULTISPECIES: hypothetical protein [Streptomyces]MYU13650.1 hypothetical protein [Streptomyces sp. SID8361]AUA16180.1 hypothetical protein CFP59_08370 [Streptomyces sp. M56]MCM3804647.1 hypothetical protein [Streptomyces sp. DR7-3]MCQ8831383.1 hypothetical protein [Streptomyces samsunensis]MYX60378.1 hypothetical protein [Streptomyces sp. SID8382]
MDRNEQPLLTPDLPPVVDVPDLTFPPQGRHSDESKRTAERDGEKETPSSAPASSPDQRPMAA